jgi:hypothetical protein
MLGDLILVSSPIKHFLSKQKVIREPFNTKIVDNGDNDGQIIPEYLESGSGSVDASRCIESWIGNMRCDKQNNRAKCNFDGGDCCLKTCLDVCTKRGYTEQQCPCRNYKLNCKNPLAPCQSCNLKHAVCKTQS